MSKDIGIDLGTANVLINVSGKGIVIDEPSVVAVDTISNKVVAVCQRRSPVLSELRPHMIIRIDASP